MSAFLIHLWMNFFLPILEVSKCNSLNLSLSTPLPGEDVLY